MRFRLIFSIVGFMIMLCGISMAVPMVVDFITGHREAGYRFAVAAGMSVAAGLLIRLLTGSDNQPLRTKEMFLTTTLVWMAYALFAAVPFFVSEYHISWTDSVFESMSGLTTTGATVLSGLDNMTPGILLWRSMTQWMGGIGIVIVAIMILPALHVGGMQFFNTESSAQSERDMPTVAKNMRAIMLYFLGLSVACAICLKAAGMDMFDAINHAMTAIATGGFSTHDASVGYFKSPAIEWVLTIFMAVAGMPLILGLYLFRRQWTPIRENIQIAFYLKFLVGTTVLLTAVRWVSDRFEPQELLQYVRQAAFNIVSVVTTTGYVSDNYQLWGSFSVAFFMFLLAVGACTGSTSGGIKMFRFAVLSRTVGVRLRSLIQPHGVFVPRYGSQVITDDILISVLVFFGLYLGTALISMLVLSFCGLDFVTSLSATLSSLSNVGPGLGHVVGPDQTFAALPAAVKWVLVLAMMMGRLEFVSVLVLFFPFLWRRNA